MRNKRVITEALDEASENSGKYGVFSKGGSAGSSAGNKPMKVFDNADDAKAYAKRLRKRLSAGEKGYYKMGYSTKLIK